MALNSRINVANLKLVAGNTYFWVTHAVNGNWWDIAKANDWLAYDPHLEIKRIRYNGPESRRPIWLTGDGKLKEINPVED